MLSSAQGFQAEDAAVGRCWAPGRGTVSRQACADVSVSEVRVCVCAQEGRTGCGRVLRAQRGRVVLFPAQARTSPALLEEFVFSAVVFPSLAELEGAVDAGWGVVLQCGHAWLEIPSTALALSGTSAHGVKGVTVVGEGGEQKQGWCSEESRAWGGVRQTPTLPAIP